MNNRNESEMTKNDVEAVHKVTQFEGHNKIDVYRMRYKLFEDGWSDEIEREVFERGHGVVVIAFDPDTDKLVLVEQFRPGAFAAISSPWFGDDISPWTIECAAGNIGEGESPETVAARELFEETGCKILDMVRVGHYFVSPSGSSQSIFIYCAHVKAPISGKIKGVCKENENIRVHSVETKTAFDWFNTGKFKALGAAYCMQWFFANHDYLTARWRTKR